MTTVERMARFVADAPDDVIEQGLGWYGDANRFARSLAKDLGISPKQAAGILAAVSPQLDAEINLSSTVTAILDGTSTVAMTGRQRTKALACLTLDPTQVLNPVTGPKTWAFFWNIYAPTLREHVTIDGRYADIIENEMRPWRAYRGIDTGGPGTKYERYEHLTEDVARCLRRQSRFKTLTAVQVQAIAWCHGKQIEMTGVTCRGTPRRQGVFRRGQTYTQPQPERTT